MQRIVQVTPNTETLHVLYEVSPSFNCQFGDLKRLRIPHRVKLVLILKPARNQSYTNIDSLPLDSVMKTVRLERQ